VVPAHAGHARSSHAERGLVLGLGKYPFSLGQAAGKWIGGRCKVSYLNNAEHCSWDC
jgi:hypothetical protein